MRIIFKDWAVVEGHGQMIGRRPDFRRAASCYQLYIYFKVGVKVFWEMQKDGAMSNK